MQADLLKGYQLFHEGIKAFAQMEHTGIRINEQYYQKWLKRIARKNKRAREKLEKTKLLKVWHRRFGSKFKLTSDSQLQRVLFTDLGLKPLKMTKKLQPAVDEEALRKLKMPELDLIIQMRVLDGIRERAEAILRESVDGIMHPFFNLHLAVSYRSQSEYVSFHNMQVRNPLAARIIRGGFIPRDGRRLGEDDYKALEVVIGGCCSGDARWKSYVEDKTKDMHRDMAADCYRLTQEQVSKLIRYAAKNKFVFPEIYGDYYVDCAHSLWDAIDELKLVTTDNIPLKHHLKSVNIHNYTQFEKHIKVVEDRFWRVRFPDYKQWREELYTEYLKTGYVDLVTGFRCYDVMRKNEVLNRPIQGPAFHCLLWSVIELIKELRRYKFKTVVIGQIHDSMLKDIIPKEEDNVMELTREIMTKRIRKHWDWIDLPLEVEMKTSKVDGSWHEMKVVEEE